MSNKMLSNDNDSDSPSVPRLAFTMKEAAQSVGCSYITIHRLIKRGLLRSSGATRHKMIPATELQRFLRDTLSK